MLRCGFFEYECIDSGIKITRYISSATFANIPPTIDSLPVTSIGDHAFDDCFNLKEVSIPESVTSIGGYAFNNCSSLMTINIPDGVTSISDNVFRCCQKLTSIIIPQSVTSIGNYAFEVCTSLKNITIPESVTSIGRQAFSSCSSLMTINIPEGVTFINDSVFRYCQNLTSIIIPDSVTRIGERAFLGCEKLTGIIIPQSVTSIGEFALGSCSSLKTVIIPDSVTYIGDKAFSFCNSLSTIYCSKKLMDSYYVKNFLDSYKNKIHYYNVPSNYFLKVKGLSTSEIIRRIEQIESFSNNINYHYRIKNSPDISSELLESLKQIDFLLTLKGYTIELNNSVEKILADIEAEYNRQNKIKVNAVLPTELSRKISGLESALAISPELVDLIKQVKDLGAKDYSPELNDSVEKVLADIKAECNRQQEKNSVINLVKLVESVSDKQITNTSQYIQKFDDEVADFLSSINAELEALRTEKAVIQNYLSEQNNENESRIRASIEALKANLEA